MRRLLWIPWRWWRRLAQAALLVAFFYLFRRTEFVGADKLPGGENALFRLDPLAAAAAMIAGRQFVTLFWPALVLLLLTLVFGRFFCGWVCPLGTLLDWFHRLLRPIARFTNRGVKSPRMATTMRAIRPARYVILIAVLLAAAFGVQMVGLADPFSLFVRAITLWGDPALYTGTESSLTWIGQRWHWPAAVGWLTYSKKHLLPFQPMVYNLAGVSAAIVAVIFALELVARRFWCRYLCPLGAGLGLISRTALVKRLPVKVCKACGDCATSCRMDALDTTAGVSPQACNLCMDCVDGCPSKIAKFGLKKPKSKLHPAPVDLSRRGVLTSVAAGLAIPAIAKAARLAHNAKVDPYLLRPPGAGDETRFLSLCVRCGECMKVCPTNVLQPIFLQAGVEGMFSPRMLPRFIFEHSYCEYNCTLCGQVCPSGAIPRLNEDEKHAHPGNKAYFDHTLCLPWAQQTPCIRCEEMCPTPDKAIKIRDTVKIKDKDGNEVELQLPYVDRDLCVGCGICECNCTLTGAPGIRARRIDGGDPGTEFRKTPAALPASKNG